MAENVHLSIVVPVYNEEGNLPELYERLAAALGALDAPAELLFVDDGSTDGSLELLKGYREKDDKVKVVRLAHNYGQQAALMAGLAHASGSVVVTLDADLQNDPADIPKFLAAINAGYDAVYGRRMDRKDPLISRKVPSYLANLLISKLAGVRLHDYGCNFKAFTGPVAEFILDSVEIGRTSTILGARGAKRITEIEVSHSKRLHGKSKYTFGMLTSLVLDIVTGYSTRPFQVVGLAGLASFVAGSAFSVYYVINRFILENPFEPRVFVLTLMLLLMGVQFMILGFLGEYVIRIYNVLPKKPLFKVREFLG